MSIILSLRHYLRAFSVLSSTPHLLVHASNRKSTPARSPNSFVGKVLPNWLSLTTQSCLLTPQIR
ncbi:hypothetical protein BJX66DRAFT_302828 [Aspergillus keveii]|uniref:Uncharacterized protein n=1 Tax=Aspergillus keveii TaxID=714993 RepID=A0ABR4G7I5_9EURO